MINVVLTGFYNKLKTYPTTWTVNTAKVVGDIVKPTTYNSHTYVCTTAGTTHAATEPTWTTTNGGTNTDGTVTWTCYGTKCYQLLAPQGSTVPYVTFGLETNRPMGTFADQADIEDSTFWVNVFSGTSPSHATVLTDLVIAVMDNSTLTVTGYTSMKCMREFIGTPIIDIETNIYMIPMRYRLWVDKD